MILAYKNSTITAIQQNIIKIRYLGTHVDQYLYRMKELNYWTSSFKTMTTESALIAGIVAL